MGEKGSKNQRPDSLQTFNNVNNQQQFSTVQSDVLLIYILYYTIEK